MLRRTLIAGFALAAALAAPAGLARAQEGWDQGDQDDQGYADQGWDDRSPDQLDVSVDVGAGAGAVTYDTFHGALSPYGEWVPVGSYGQVWRPRVAAGWRPYYQGRWEWTNEGWLWVSDEPWGWATYHYGRWAYDSFYGWVWVPGYQWAPAWVSWRYSGDVVGWAPLAPGFSIYVSSYPFYEPSWTFVPCTSFVGVPVYSVAYAPSYTRQFFYRTAPAPARPAPRGYGGYAYGGPRPAPAPTPAWGGPAPRAIEQRIGRPLTPARVIAAPSPGAGHARSGEIAIYRPERVAPRAVGTPGPRADVGRSAGFAPAPAQGWGPPGNRGQAAPVYRPESRGAPPAPAYQPAPRGAPAYQAAPRGQGAPAYQATPRGQAPGYQAAPRGQAPAYQPAPRGQGGGAPAPARGGGNGGGGRPQAAGREGRRQ